MYQLSFYVPADSLEAVKDAVFAAGSGRIGDYDHCCWQTLGRGQFRPLSGSNPAIGARGALNYVDEYKVELVIDDAFVDAVIAALRAAHPYEAPAFALIQLTS